MPGVILLGAGGHAKVVLELLQLTRTPVLGVICPKLQQLQIRQWRGITVLGDDTALVRFDQTQVKLVNGVGMMPMSSAHYQVFINAQNAGFEFLTLVHPSAVVSPSLQIGQGGLIMAGAIIQADCVMADNVIINSRALIEHDCQIASHSHVAPGAVLCGQVSVGEQAFIGAGATVIQQITVGHRAIIGAGTVIVKDVAADTIVKGVAAMVPGLIATS